MKTVTSFLSADVFSEIFHGVSRPSFIDRLIKIFFTHVLTERLVTMTQGSVKQLFMYNRAILLNVIAIMDLGIEIGSLCVFIQCEDNNGTSSFFLLLSRGPQLTYLGRLNNLERRGV